MMAWGRMEVAPSLHPLSEVSSDDLRTLKIPRRGSWYECKSFRPVSPALMNRSFMTEEPPGGWMFHGL